MWEGMCQGVGGVRCDGRITAGRFEALGCEFGAIGGVNHIVRNARVVRMLLQQGIKNGNGFLQIFSGIHVFICERNKRERIECADFHIARRLGVKFLKC